MIRITIGPATQKRIAELQAIPEQVNAAIGRGLYQGAFDAAGIIQTKRLTGVGPFPPAQHRLGNRSFVLMESLQADKSVTGPNVTATGATVSIGTKVKYARIHEFGGTIHRKAGHVRLTLSTRKFAKKKDQNVSHHPHAAYDIRMPERAPIRTGIQDAAPEFTKRIAIQVKQLWEGARTE